MFFLIVLPYNILMCFDYRVIPLYESGSIKLYGSGVVLKQEPIVIFLTMIKMFILLLLNTERYAIFHHELRISWKAYEVKQAEKQTKTKYAYY
jgi:hypothetical protein